jgi:aminoglycoside phosphotransferase (APT) family kinase protein
VDYETEVYRRVVRPSRATAPRFYGARTDDATGEVWLVLGYLDGAVRLRDKKEPSAWDMAAARVGDFHAAHEVPPAGPRPDFPRAYDADYYAGWARRTIEYTRPLHQDLPWLDAVCRRFEGALAPLLEPSQTVIHGECYPMNLLCHGGEIYLVDWESAAVGPGEIDLATLTERCEADIAGRCELAYCRARWPRGAPASFARRLDLARLYVHFRWLGDGPGRKKPWRLEEVRTLGERLGLL